jgi:hypothetical protein
MFVVLERFLAALCCWCAILQSWTELKHCILTFCNRRNVASTIFPSMLSNGSLNLETIGLLFWVKLSSNMLEGNEEWRQIAWKKQHCQRPLKCLLCCFSHSPLIANLSSYIYFSCCRSLVLFLSVLLQWGISPVSFIEKRKRKKSAVVCQWNALKLCGLILCRVWDCDCQNP